MFFPNQIEYNMNSPIRQMVFLLNYKPVIMKNIGQMCGRSANR